MLVCLKKTFLKQKEKKEKRAHEIAQSTNRTTPLSETVHNTILEKATEETGLLEQGEINANVPNLSVTSLAIKDTQQTSSQTIDDRIINRGGYRSRGRRPFYRNTGENDPYDMSIAPLNIFENQVIPIGLHNLSKSFRPNIATIRVLSLGTKFIPKWKFEKRNNAFKHFNDFIRRMHNKVYFTETKTGVFEKNPKFKLKSNFVANTQYKEIEAFGWKIRDRIDNAIESMIKAKTKQNISNKEKTALRNLIRAKNTKIIINDTDKNIWAADADKEDVISECVRQLSDIKTYLKLTEEEIKSIITEIQNKLKRTVESHLYKGNCTRKEADFLLSKMYVFDVPHFYIIWKILKNPIVGRPIVAGYNWIF